MRGCRYPGGGCCANRPPGSTSGGDGSLVAFRGTVAREELEPGAGETPFDAVRKTLSGETG